MPGTNGIDRLLKDNKVDALIGPTVSAAWPIDAVNGDQYPGGGAGYLAAIAGYPHLTVPMGQVKGLPVGLSFIGPKWSDALLLGLGYAYEQARGPLPAPALPAVDRAGAGDRAAAGEAGQAVSYAVSFRAAMQPTMPRISSSRSVVVGSLKKAIPTITVPTAPIPPQTA